MGGHGAAGGGGASASASGNGNSAALAPSATPAGTVLTISVNSGPTGQLQNVVTASVTVCVPGTTSGQTIQNVQVDTGSSGLRLPASAVTMALPTVLAASSGGDQECAGFADGVVWGAVATADVKLAGESAAAVSIQLIQDKAVSPGVPAACSAQGAPEDRLTYLCASNGSCSLAVMSLTMISLTMMSLTAQVSNPAAIFAQDNNGVILRLPMIAASGTPSAAGSLIFGIGTQANNSQAGIFTALYRGTTLPNRFFDNGSPGLNLDDTAIPVCPCAGVAGDLSGFHCPGPATALSALPISVTITGSNGVSAAVTASVANAQFLDTQVAATSLNAFDELAGPAGATLPGAFDFGMPLFVGKRVHTGFEQRTSSAGTRSFFAYPALP